MDDLAEVLRSVQRVMATWPGDWGHDPRLAWLFGIFCDWGDALDGVAEQYDWTETEKARLRRYAAAVQQTVAGRER